MEIREKQCNNDVGCVNSNNILLTTSVHNKEILLNLSMDVADKVDNQLFGTDQTPTPTSLIKNCEEVGLFDDLQHVNPFEETFRRAIEQKVGQTPTISHQTEVDCIEDSLHTPQVFPQLESINNNGCDILGSSSALDVPAVDDELLSIDSPFRLNATSRQNSGSCVLNATNDYNKNPMNNNNSVQYLQLPSTVQLLQHPPVITLNLTANNLPTVAIKPTIISSSSNSISSNNNNNNAAAIPVQTVKPFICPKPSTIIKESQNISKTDPTTTSATAKTTLTSTLSSTTSNTNTQLICSPEPSSASLTPTSQLPIKERLKAILNTSSKCHKSSASNIGNNNNSISKISNDINEAPTTTSLCDAKNATIPPKSSCKKIFKMKTKNSTDGIERKRAAAMRYRHKMRNEHLQLQTQNAELRAENQKLRLRLEQLEEQLIGKQQQQAMNVGAAGVITVPAQIQIPSSSIQFVMNLPKLTVPLTGHAQILNAINYDFNRK